MDAGTGLTLLGSAVGGFKILEKVLGPTAEYLGDGLQLYSRKKLENLSVIFKKASEKFDLESIEPGSVNPRILNAVIESGSYCEDDLPREYLAGLLASGRCHDGSDDRASFYLGLNSDLSSIQIRFHYICYLIISRIFHGESFNFVSDHELAKMQILLPYPLLWEAMELTTIENPLGILAHCTSGLRSKNIILCQGWGSAAWINSTGLANHGNKWNGVRTDGVLVSPTQVGIDYFIWGLGLGSTVERADFLTPKFSAAELSMVKIMEGAVRTQL